ncbi:TetR/AcrR family transcriptional regulator [Noviherbaspirillum sp.]|uniref:TetR/AcrR family transcriptional regulator n=1 Tax=Noviherbaspirillum sp. TaxID=1926288 RepID=UPI002FE1ED47
MKNPGVATVQEESRPPRRSTYRHGDLYRALLEAGVELARTGGPDAVVLREVTRQAGVVPNAAYRHFADRQALLEAVCDAAQARLALAIETELAALPKKKDPVKAAHGRLRAIGAAYVKFARAEPGLFRTAFSVPPNLDQSASPAKAGSSGLSPFQHLSAALDAMADAGALPAERRKGAEFLAWSAVHGLAMLLLDGPLRQLDDAHAAATRERLLDMVVQGL